MKILFLCTAHNSLSQRLYLVLSSSHDVTIEYAISEEVMIAAAALARPDLIICPFLTTLVPRQLYESYLTLIIHPGPPGDAGPSSLDWVLMGDDGCMDDPSEQLELIDRVASSGRTHWGLTVLQANEEFDAGPVWAFEQFRIDIDEPGLTNHSAGHHTHRDAALSSAHEFAGSPKPFEVCGLGIQQVALSPWLKPRAEYGRLSVTDQIPFQGGSLKHRPLLKAAQRAFDVTKHTAQQISRRIRASDSQPGVLSSIFGRPLYVYGGVIDGLVDVYNQPTVSIGTVDVLATRGGAVCITTCDDKGVWITHVRRPKTKADKSLFPKVPAISALIELGLMKAEDVPRLHAPVPSEWSRSDQTLQEVWFDITTDENANRIAYLHFDFYNGAMSYAQCSELIEAMHAILSYHNPEAPLRALVLMGGAYFSNGIALNVIEASSDPAAESWSNINRIDDVVELLLHVFPQRNILTIAAVRGNAAAGGVALATACDFVVAGSDVVLNPAYRAIGLHGSEYHSLSYHGRCGNAQATHLLRSMTPMSPFQAQAIGLVDFVFPTGPCLDENICYHISLLTKNPALHRGHWKSNVDLSPASLARARARELSEMAKDFWSLRSVRYHSRRHDFVRKVKSNHTPLRFATHRRFLQGVQIDEEELDSFDDVSHYEEQARQRMIEDLRHEIRKELLADMEVIPKALHRDLVALKTAQGRRRPATPGGERSSETIFSCYYKPVDVLTPPDSP
ncbi:hypothetical protein LTR10_003068 [Elasticomyces elasticus]|nr:hypothetical protein LTR10_003068 [Elasticomyces elasticus]KAK4969344.1 hypothetical protein LTR42_008611 [Elasticomyces elasticus]